MNHDLKLVVKNIFLVVTPLTTEKISQPNLPLILHGSQSKFDGEELN
jgi:hypothetical protein